MTEVQETVAEQAQEQVQELTQEQQIEQLYKVSSMRHKVLSDLVGVNMNPFLSIMMSSNGVSQKEKLMAAEALKEAVIFALDYGLNISQAGIREKGHLAKQVNTLAGVLVQSFDNRFLLLADKIKKEEDARINAESQQTTTEEVSNVNN